MTRLPNGEIPSFLDAVTRALDVDPRSLAEQPGSAFDNRGFPPDHVLGYPVAPGSVLTRGEVSKTIRCLGGEVLMKVAHWEHYRQDRFRSRRDIVLWYFKSERPEVLRCLDFIFDELIPRLKRTTDELTNLLRGLDGQFVPAGPSGAPTRGMAHILPTGRNFYSVDIHTIPTEAAWKVGRQAADRLIEKYRGENDGEYPRSVGLVVWGTSTMRTHGDDVAEILCLMGCRPAWSAENRRVKGVELIPLDELGRPRIDVTVRISGFFRDAFPNVVNLIDRAVELVADADESESQNYLRENVRRESAKGIDPEQARYRIFGAKPGSYGAGLLNLIDERNWRTDADLANVYITWGSYAYTRTEHGKPAAEPFKRRLSQVTIAVQNQDNREHDILDSDDYFQFHGGMIAAIRSLTGANPAAYFGDTSNPGQVRVRDLQEEVYRVFRSRVVNPKWIAAAMRHGYKGASEMAATVDYLFGYEATAGVIDDWMFEELGRSYLMDEEVQSFLQEKNPWALRAMAERLLEAIDRGLWEQPSAGMVEALGGFICGMRACWRVGRGSRWCNSCTLHNGAFHAPYGDDDVRACSSCGRGIVRPGILAQDAPGARLRLRGRWPGAGARRVWGVLAGDEIRSPKNHLAMRTRGSARRILLYAWAAPTTCVGLVAGFITLATGGRVQVRRGVVEFYGGFAGWFFRRTGFAAMTLGHAILGRDRECLDWARDHEHVHVRQVERWGPFFLPAYLFLCAWEGLRGRRPYRDNWFEREAYGDLERES